MPKFRALLSAVTLAAVAVIGPCASPAHAEPITVHADESGVREAVSISTATSDALWPETDPTEAGFNLLLVHLQELIDTGRAPILIDPKGILGPVETPEGPIAAPDLAGDGLLRSPITGQVHPPHRRRHQRRP